MSEPDDELLARALLNRPAAVIIRCQNTNGQRCLLGKVVWMETGHRF